MANVQLEAVISARDNASRTLAGVGKSAGGLGNVLRTGLKVGAVAAGAAVAGLTAFAIKSVKAFNESQKVLAQTNAVLKSTKGIAGVTAKQVSNLASKFQLLTTYSDEQIQSAENLLLTFTKINSKVFPQATETVLDMSTALGQDLKSSAIQLGKALQDPILGVTALRRVGVNFGDAEKKVITQMVKAGKTMKAQQYILKELRTEFGGSARAAGKTFAGQLAILGNQFDDLKEKIGRAILTAIAPFIKQLTDWAKKKETQQKLQEMVTAFGKWLSVVITWIKTHWPAIKNTFQTLGTIIKGIGSVIKGFYTIWESTFYAIFRIVDIFSRTMARATGYVVGFIYGGIASFKRFVSGIGSALGRVWSVITSPFRSAFNWIKSQLKSLWYTFQYYLGLITGRKYTPRPPKGFQAGGLVPQTGLAMVHKGEYVKPQGAYAKGGGDITVNITGPVNMASNADVDAVAKRLARQLSLARMGAY